MAAHKQRSGKLLVCWYCKNDQCADSPFHGLADLVCHCSCQPVCDRPACQVIKTGRRTKRVVCPTCYLTSCDCAPNRR